MNKINYTKRAASLFLFSMLFVLKSHSVHAQLITYTNDTGGVLSMVATNVTADTLKRVNGASRLSTPCTHGFSTKGFTNVATYSDTLEAVQVTLGPTSGHVLRIDSFLADLRYSPTGPQKARFAYSINGGSTWIDQGTNQNPFLSGTCDSMVTCKWMHTVLLYYPSRLMFRVYGFGTSVTTGTGNLQIMNLQVNGTVLSTTSIQQNEFEEQGFSVFPNPATDEFSVSYTVSTESNVSLKVYNILGQEVCNLNSDERQMPGNYHYKVPPMARGVYFVRMTVDGQTFSRKVVKI